MFFGLVFLDIFLNVDLEQIIGEAADITIYNSLGQMVKAIKIDEVQNSIERIDIPNFEMGTYIMSIQTEENTVVKKFVVGTQRP